MAKYQKLSKAKIDKMMSGISRRIYLCENTTVESFKQVKIGDEYTPYLISSFGRVFSLANGKPYELKPLKTQITGYYAVTLYFGDRCKRCNIHRLVANHFIKNKNNLPVINHKDADKSNNAFWNLEWCTQKYNVHHAQDKGLWTTYGEKNANNVYSRTQIESVCKLLTKNIPLLKIEKLTGVSVANIRHILRKQTWIDVSSKYDFSDYSYGKDKKKVYEKSLKLHKACKLLEENKLTMQEIADETGLPYIDVKNIFRGNRYKRISRLYNISNFNKIKKYKTK